MRNPLSDGQVIALLYAILGVENVGVDAAGDPVLRDSSPMVLRVLEGILGVDRVPSSGEVNRVMRHYSVVPQSAVEDVMALAFVFDNMALSMYAHAEREEQKMREIENAKNAQPKDKGVV